MPSFILQSLLKGKYTSEIDMFYADTFPFREELISLSSGIKDLRGFTYDGVRFNKIGMLALNQDNTQGNKPEDNTRY